MRNFIVGVLLTTGANTIATAAEVNPNLPMGVSLNSFELASSGQWQLAVLSPDQRPSAMVLNSYSAAIQLHLGTGTDLFAAYEQTPIDIMQPADSYWVRYTLDSSSYSYQQNWNGLETSPVSGELWVSFKPQPSGYWVSVDFEKVVGQGEDLEDLNTNWLAEGQVGVQSLHNFSYPSNCTPGDCGGVSVNLSFLALNWNGAGYELVTATHGFDEVFGASAYTDSYGAVYRVAPVPLPSSAVLLMSGLIGLIGSRRFHKSVI